MKKRGQVTIFIIIAILIVAVVALFLMIPKLSQGIGIKKAENPEIFIQTCLEDSIKDNADIIASQGGTLEPEHYYLYQDNKLDYLVYTNEYYTLGNVQIPFMEQHVENEIKKSIEEDVDFCFNSLKDKYNGRVVKGDVKVDLLPGKIITTINNSFTFTKGEDTERRENFRVVVNNNLYELTSIAQNIGEWESNYGEADTEYYMGLYHNLKVEKHPQSDETYVYIITDKNTGDKFQFASRSLAFAPI